MPAAIEHVRSCIGLHQHKHAGRDAPSALARNVQRFGAQPRRFDPTTVSNQLVLLAAISTLHPCMATRAGTNVSVGTCVQRPPGHGPARAGWPPGAAAAETVALEMHGPTGTDPGAAALLAQPTVAHVATLAEGAVATCVFRPQRCGTALLAVLPAGAVGAAVGWVAATLQHTDTPDRNAAAARTETPPPPRRTAYHLIHDALPPATRFDATQRDESLSPCQSLGAHINQRWEEAMSLAPSRSRVGTFEQLRDRSLLIRQQLIEQIAAQPVPTPGEKLLGDLWVAGMDAAGIEAAGRTPIQPTLTAIDALPDNDALFGWLTAAAVRARNPLFAFTVQPDQEDSSRYTAYLAQAGLGLPDSAWYIEPDHATMVEAYRTHIARMLVLTGVPHDEAESRAAAVLALETDLAGVSLPFQVLATDDSVFHHPVDLAQARAQTPHMDWSAFFAAHGHPVPARFSLGMPGFFRRVDTLLQTLPLQTWKDYLQFHVLDRAAPALSSTFVEAHAAFHDRILKGRQALVPRWAQILDMIERSAGQALGPAYVQTAYPAEAAADVEALTAALRQALDRRLAASSFMDPQTRAHARLKASRMRIEVGHPSRWEPWEGVHSGRSDFLAGLEAADAHVHQRNIGQLGQPMQTDHWKMTPQTVDAYHDMLQNHIVLPAALLQPPLFDPMADAALNYAGLGVILGHEMAHAFDAMGSRVDAEGAQRDWLGAEDRARFDAMTERLARQFSQYTVHGHAIDGDLTLDENLADLGGLTIALDALQYVTAGEPDPMIDGMTREQRFFAAFAFSWRSVTTPERLVLELATNPHVPGRVRADGAPSNMPAFAKAFNCSEGQPMARPAADRVAFP